MSPEGARRPSGIFGILDSISVDVHVVRVWWQFLLNKCQTLRLESLPPLVGVRGQ